MHIDEEKLFGGMSRMSIYLNGIITGALAAALVAVAIDGVGRLL